jgi:hypothetical protein
MRFGLQNTLCGRAFSTSAPLSQHVLFENCEISLPSAAAHMHPRTLFLSVPLPALSQMSFLKKMPPFFWRIDVIMHGYSVEEILTSRGTCYKKIQVVKEKHSSE